MFGKQKLYIVLASLLLLCGDYLLQMKNLVNTTEFLVWDSNSALESSDFMHSYLLLPIVKEKNGIKYQVGATVSSFIKLIELNDHNPKAYTIVNRYRS